MKFGSLLILFSLLYHVAGLGQMTVQPSNVPPITTKNIIQNVFLGDGVEIINTQYDGLEGSVGLFDNGEAVIGLGKGIIMSTGNALNATKANNNMASISGNTTDATIIDTDLEALANVEVMDVSRFEITFVPSSEVLQFRYVFASEEYPNFVCADNNDVFGFFISGPNPNGGNYVAENIALVPDPADAQMNTFLDLPVTINSVNSGVPGLFSTGDCNATGESLGYSNYFNEVAEGNTPAYNGYLDVFVARANVIPCQEYTIKIAIGDGKDQSEDSAVFLEGRSFSTSALQVDIDNPGIDGSLAEGCEYGQIILSISEPRSEDLPIEYELISSLGVVNPAIPGLDYEDFPRDLMIPAGQTELIVPIVPIADQDEEGTEFIYLSIRRSVCTVDTFILPLFDNNLALVELQDTIYACLDETFTLDVDLGDYLNPSDNAIFTSSGTEEISKDNEFTSSVIEVQLKDIDLSPDIIAEICIDSLIHPRLNDLDLYLEAPSGQVLELSTDNGWRLNNNDQDDALVQTCFSFDATQNINLGEPSEGILDLSNPTYTGHYLPEGSVSEWLYPIPSTLNGSYTLFIIDDNKLMDGKLFSWHISFNPKYDLSYDWAPATSLDCTSCEAPTGVATSSQYYNLELVDSYGCVHSDSLFLSANEKTSPPELTCIPLENGQIKYEWEKINGTATYEISLDGADEWLPTTMAGMIQFSFYGIEIIDINQIIVSGVADNESLSISMRVIDQGGCIGLTTSVGCSPLPCSTSAPQIENINISEPECAGETIEVSIMMVSNNLPLNYLIELDSIIVENETGVFDGLPAGEWVVHITDSNGCSVDSLIQISEMNLGDIQSEINHISCFGARDGHISVVANGFVSPVQFLWSNNETTSEINDLRPGNYNLTITDAAGCSATRSYEISQPEVMTYVYIQSDSLDCSGDNSAYATLSINGGVEPYEIVWSGTLTSDTIRDIEPGVLEFTINDNSGCSIEGQETVIQKADFEVMFINVSELACYADTTGEAAIRILSGNGPFEYLWENGDTTPSSSKLRSGPNSVTITDINGCQTVSSVDILSPPEILIASSISSPSCFDSQDGSIEIEVDGGTGDFDFLWPDDSTNSAMTGLSPTTYCVTITDNSACRQIECFDIPETTELGILKEVQKVGCNTGNDGAIDITPIGGSGDYLYQWTGSDNFTSEEQDIVGLAVGSYTLILKDANAPECQTYPIDIDVDIASEISALIQVVDTVSCYGSATATIQAIPVGGAAPFTYDWSHADLEDRTAENLPAGTYYVTITDSENCYEVSEIILTEPEDISVTSEKVDVLCYGENTGSLGFEITGGVGDKAILWEDGSSDLQKSGLASGLYQITITDQNNCTITYTEEITQPSQPTTITYDKIDVGCYGRATGQVILSAISNAEPVQYELDGKIQGSNNFTELPAGNYTFSVIDRNNCSEAIEIEILEAEEIEIEYMNDLQVPFGSDLQLELQLSHHVGAVSYKWSSPYMALFECSDCPNPVIRNIEKSFSGSVKIIDSNSCSVEDYFNIDVLDENVIDVPTGFSPNGDNANDVLHVFGNEDITINLFRIYSRSGSIVFEATDFTPNDLDIGWNGIMDGNSAPMDSYLWTIEYRLPNGRLEQARGQTTLIR